MPGAFTTTTTLPPVSGGDLSIPGTAATVITSPVGVGGVTSIDGKTGSVSLTGDYVAVTDKGVGVDIPLPLAATLTAATAPAITTTQPYDATAGALAPILPALSGLSVGQRVAVQKSAADASANLVTLTCAGGDTFDSGATTLNLKVTGELRELRVVSVSGTKKWKVAGGNTPLTGLDSRYSFKRAEDPRAYGLTGGADDSAALAAAITAAGVGGTVELPPNLTIRVRPSTPLQIAGVEIRGASGGGSVISCDRDLTVFQDINGSGTTLRDFVFDNHTTGARTNPDFDFVNPVHPVIDGVKITRADTATGAPSVYFRKDSGSPGYSTGGFMPVLSRFWLANGWMKIEGVTDGKMSDSFVWGTFTGADGTIELAGSGGWTFTAVDVIPPSGGDGAGYLFSTSMTVNTTILGGYIDGSYAGILTGNGIVSTAAVRALRAIGLGFYNLGRSGLKLAGTSHSTFQGCMFSQNNKADNFYPDVTLASCVGNTFVGNIHRAPDLRTNLGKVYVEDGSCGDNEFAIPTIEIDPTIVPNGHYYDPAQFSLVDSAHILSPRPNARWRFSTSKTQTSAYTVTVYDLFQRRTIFVSAAAAIALPSAGGVHAGDSVVIKNTDAAQSTVITPNGAQTIDGAATWTLAPRQSVTLTTDGSNWQTTAGNLTAVTGSIPESSVTGLVADLAAKATDTAVVHNTGTETVAGGKTFSSALAASAGVTVTGNLLTSGNGLRLLDNTRTGAVTLTTTSPTFEDFDCTSGAFTITLPATTSAGILFVFKKKDSSANAGTVSAGGGTIDGAATIALAHQYDAIAVRSTGTSGVWEIVWRYSASVAW